jgi:predicted dehydrogenase
MTPLNVGFLGYGFSTKCFHLPFILPNPDLKVYAFLQRSPPPPASSNPEKGKHCTIDYPEAKHYQTAGGLFADKYIDLIIVCTRHESHAELAEQALLAGKHGKCNSLRKMDECNEADLL